MRGFGHLVARRHRWILLAWLAVTAAGFALTLGGFGGTPLFDRLTSGAPQVPGESQDGHALLTESASASETINLLLADVDPASPDVEAAVTAARADLLQRDGVASVLDPYVPAEAVPSGTAFDPRAFISTDGDKILVITSLATELTAAEQDDAHEAAVQRLDRVDDDLRASEVEATGTVGSVPALIDTISHQAEEDLRTGEVVALPLSLLVMVVVFAGFLAAGLPIIGAIASIAGALASIYALTSVIDFDASVVSVVTVLGLGLCIDYGLLLVSRYREELRRLRAPEAGTPGHDAGALTPEALETALGTTLATAGRTVLFSGLTVAISLTGLLVFHAELLRGVGAAGISVVLVALVVAITLVPALIATFGERLVRPGMASRLPGVRRLGDVAPDEGVFSRLARAVQHRPWVVAVATIAVLVLFSVPSWSMRLVNSGVGLLPAADPQRVLFETIAEEFPALATAPVIVVAEAAADEIAPVVPQLETLDGVTAVGPLEERTLVTDTGSEPVTVLPVHVDGDPNSDVAQDVVHETRDVVAPLVEAGTPVHVTGEAAQLVDFVDDILTQAPWAIAIVVLATFVLLFLLTGSVLVPAKALAMNVISLGASFGVLVWVFQEGHLEDLLGFTSAGGIETFIPPLVLAFGFGLAMDYEVFLLSRIKELKDSGLSNDEAVVAGLQRSGRIITSAALVIVVVFSGFVAGQLLVIKQTGVALAVAVAIDATLVRMLLVPATMTLLGEWNWWAPGPLRRLHARIGLRES